MQQPQPVPFPTIFSIDAKGHDNFFVFLQVQALPSGAISLSFGAKSDPLSQDISALVLHLYNSEVKQEVTTGKAPALAAVTEVCIVYCAVTYCGLYWPHSIEVLHDNVPALADVTAVT